MAAPKKTDSPATPETAVVEKIPPTDPRADLQDILDYLKQFAGDVDKIAAALVHHERQRSRVDHGNFTGGISGGYPGARTTADDHALTSRLRHLSAICTEFSSYVRRSS
jgi:hypothetical protein